MGWERSCLGYLTSDERLAHDPVTVGVVTRGFGVSKPTISKRLKVLERAGVVVRTVQDRTHQRDLNVAPLVEAAERLDRLGAAV